MRSLSLTTKLFFASIALLVLAFTLYYFNRPVSFTLPETTLSFYCWENEFSLDSNEYKFLNKNNVKHLHVKVFELSWSNYPGKVTISNHTQSYWSNFSDEYFKENKLTPVVFINNDIFYKIDSAGIRNMAGLVKRAMKIHTVDFIFNGGNDWDNYYEKMYFSLEVEKDNSDSMNIIYDMFKKNIVSYEFDCDWTEKTRDKYFYFLKNVKDTLQSPVESTLRLHQYKYRAKMGIPPADKVNLMCYNMGEFKKINESNSILNINTLKKYMDKQKTYPLRMNIALPTFSWSIVFRNDRFYKLISHSSLGTHDIENALYCCLEKISENRYVVKEDYYRYVWSEEALLKGDQLRIEEIDAKNFEEAYSYIKNDLALNFSELIIFDLNSTVKMQKTDDLEKSINSK